MYNKNSKFSHRATFEKLILLSGKELVLIELQELCSYEGWILNFEVKLFGLTN